MVSSKTMQLHKLKVVPALNQATNKYKSAVNSSHCHHNLQDSHHNQTSTQQHYLLVYQYCNMCREVNKG